MILGREKMALWRVATVNLVMDCLEAVGEILRTALELPLGCHSAVSEVTERCREVTERGTGD